MVLRESGYTQQDAIQHRNFDAVAAGLLYGVHSVRIERRIGAKQYRGRHQHVIGSAMRRTCAVDLFLKKEFVVNAKYSYKTEPQDTNIPPLCLI